MFTEILLLKKSRQKHFCMHAIFEKHKYVYQKLKVTFLKMTSLQKLVHQIKTRKDMKNPNTGREKKIPTVLKDKIAIIFERLSLDHLYILP